MGGVATTGISGSCSGLDCRGAFRGRAKISRPRRLNCGRERSFIFSLCSAAFKGRATASAGGGAAAGTSRRTTFCLGRAISPYCYFDSSGRRTSTTANGLRLGACLICACTGRTWRTSGFTSTCGAATRGRRTGRKSCCRNFSEGVDDSRGRFSFPASVSFGGG